MPAVRIVDVEDVVWMGPKEGQSGGLEQVADGDDRAAARFLHPGSETELYLHEARTPPNMEILPHVHRTDEIIYVTAGEMHLGARVIGPGSSVYIPANTLYGFTAGPEGLTFLNFRALRDTSHVLKEDFLAERAAARAMEQRSRAGDHGVDVHEIVNEELPGPRAGVGYFHDIDALRDWVDDGSAHRLGARLGSRVSALRRS